MSKPFDFLSLPSEIRCKVYGYLFTLNKVSISSEPIHIIDRDTYNLSFVEELPRSSQLMSTCRAILDEAKPIFFRQMYFHVPRYESTPYHWRYQSPIFSMAQEIQLIHVDIGLGDLHDFRDRMDNHYWLVKQHLTLLELTCVAPEWRRGPHLPFMGGVPVSRPTYQKAHDIMSTIALMFMTRSNLNHMIDVSKVDKRIQFALHRSEDVKVSKRILRCRYELT